MTHINLSFSSEGTEQTASFTGELTRLSASGITKKEIKQLLAPSAITIDLSTLTHIDTAGLAWFFYLLEQAEKTNCKLNFTNLPVKLEKLISLSGVDGFLPVNA